MFKSIAEDINNFKSFYVFLFGGGGGVGGRCCLKIRDVCVDFEPCFKVLKASNLVTNLSVIVHVVVSVYRLVKI